MLSRSPLYLFQNLESICAGDRLISLSELTTVYVDRSSADSGALPGLSTTMDFIPASSAALTSLT